ncbi:MAG: hypothetical protein HY055_01855 [Magnetospirillum sp.]|nr:hypothetical protein [Magnetospirillum sp.]
MVGRSAVIRRQLTLAINAALGDETRYAAKLQAGGDFGAAKLAWAAIAEIRLALGSCASHDDDVYALHLGESLMDKRRDYLDLWDDPDGIGTSSFSRILDLVDSVT